ncbi:hypothetical protein HDU97_008699 [Phlyctochytrium planicorne]|nr:hypothetical protein HDU97_008699 [Phlyctochytrium planicorne]
MSRRSDEVTTLAGGATARCPPVFTLDSKYFLIAVSTHIKMFSILTGQLVRTISAAAGTAHLGMVTQIVLNPKNQFQLFSASLDGTIKLWDINDGSLLKTWNLYQPVTHIVLDPKDSKMAYVAVKRSSSFGAKGVSMKRKLQKGQIASVKLELGNKTESPELERLMKIRDCAGLGITADVLIVAAGFRFDVIRLGDSARFSFTQKEKINAICVHPTDPCVAVGLMNGEIHIWYCLADLSQENPAVVRLHWHAHQVNCLQFSSDGVYLYSGGEEAVMVIWQLATRHKQFLPRLGSEIHSIGISKDQMLYGVSLSDNTIRIVSAVDLSITQSVSGLKAAALALRPKFYGLDPTAKGREVLWQSPFRYQHPGVTIDPRSNLAVLIAGLDSTIQFFNAPEDRHVLEIETSPRNRVTRTDTEDIPQVHLTEVAFSTDGNWMATVDINPSFDGFIDQNIKVWEFDSASQSYVVNTRIASPHTDLITAIRFSPPSPSENSKSPQLLLTTSLDSKFKTWQLHAATGSSQTKRNTKSHISNTTPEAFEAFWSPRSVGTHRSYPIHDAAFSWDGSVVALATGAVVTLWDPYSAVLRAVLSHPPATDPVLSLGFTGGSFRPTPSKSTNSSECQIPFLASMTSTRLHVWNLLTCTVWWTFSLDAGVPTCIRVDPETEFFSVGMVRKVFNYSQDVLEEKKDGEDDKADAKGNEEPEEIAGDDKAEEDAMDEDNERTEGEEKTDGEAAEDFAEKTKKKKRGKSKSSKKKNKQKEVFLYYTDVLVFSPLSPSPRTCHTLEGMIRGITFLPSAVSPKGAASSDRCLILSDLYELQVLGDWNRLENGGAGSSSQSSSTAKAGAKKTEKNRYLTSLAGTEVEEPEKIGLLTSVYGADATKSVTSISKALKQVANIGLGEVASSAVAKKAQDISNLAFWDGPTYLLPDPSLMIGPLLEGMLPKHDGSGPQKAKVRWDDIVKASAELDNFRHGVSDVMDMDETVDGQRNTDGQTISLCYRDDEEATLGGLGSIVDVLRNIYLGGEANGANSDKSTPSKTVANGGEKRKKENGMAGPDQELSANNGAQVSANPLSGKKNKRKSLDGKV